ncbi:hypothetical protein M2451_000428 [Dysgonomonas sp. PFB1-18]|uniref:hypothetical protein n=1 Tax=unclassified Dysgonomonas TaxID=2630389 RepID=UPI00247413CC|nr:MULTISPECIES: hypothetical protein [unclassified Dysgonomonas]MDH6307279.1 hypothetical protein [Dysgonomonas sp. PF1-14]MDH6337197.1 hypothetical protein [Dysgonomonas sp. PF1-16]MDH6379121.1 hypothetical protein [Dysgonomonas sp. PFB1-18]MDH6396242.1 hypothetical protein [Dysgonomonas sp. PF1-23]
MGTFFYLIIISIIVFRVVKYLNKNKGEQDEWASSRNRPVQPQPQPVKKTSFYDFKDDDGDKEVIESPYGFYTFMVDWDKKEFSIVQDKGEKINVVFFNLKGYEVKTRNDAVITLELKTYLPGKSFISIECFSKIKVLPQLPEWQRRPLELNKVYDQELAQVDEIDDILSDIMDENGVQSTTTPPPYKQEKKIQEKKETPVAVPVVPNILDIVESIPEKKEEIEIKTEPEEIPIVEIPAVIIEEVKEEIPEIKSERQEIKIEDPFESTPPYEEIKIEGRPVEPVPDSEDAGDKVRVSLSDVEYYSYGKFLDSEVQSAVGDAKMRGKKEIFITKEQLEKLKQ